MQWTNCEKRTTEYIFLNSFNENLCNVNKIYAARKGLIYDTEWSLSHEGHKNKKRERNKGSNVTQWEGEQINTIELIWEA